MPRSCTTYPDHITRTADRHDYSQWGEQRHILEFFRGRPPARFLDLGAFNGVTGSNVRALAEDGWSGVCVEADPHRFPELVAHMAQFPTVKCLSMAVMPETGMTKFYGTGNQCGTCLEENHIRQYIQASFHVAALSPADLARQIGDDFQFVSLDIEGMDLPVLKTLGPLLVHCELVCIEDAIPSQPFDPAYYQQLLDALAVHGFTRVIGRTKPATMRDAAANTLVARAV
jgi:FkbM family methyltransferase